MSGKGTVITFPILGDDFSLNPGKYFTVFGIDIHWYGVIITCGLLLAVYYVMKRSREFGITEDNIVDMLLYTLPIGIIGARLYYVVFNFSIYKDNFVDVFKIWEGGLAIYGGIIFGILGIWLCCRRKKIKFSAMLDLCSFGVIIGQAIGRWGNFMNREAYGAVTDIPWKMGLTFASGKTIYVHPLFLYESLWNVLGLIFLHFYSQKHRRYDGQMFAMYVGWYGFGRFFTEWVRDSNDSLRLFNTDIRVSQLVALLSFVAAVVFLIYNRVKVSHDPKDMYVNSKKSDDALKTVGVTASDAAAASIENETEQDITGESNINNNKNEENKEE